MSFAIFGKLLFHVSLVLNAYAGATSLVLANAFYFIYRKPEQGQDTAE